jgi:hypothetical protein
VEKILLTVSGDNGEVFLDEVVAVQNQNGGDFQQLSERDQLLGLHSQMSSVLRAVDRVLAAQDEDQVKQPREHRTANANIRRIAVQSGIRRAAAAAVPAAAGGGGGAIPFIATHSANPRMLCPMWDKCKNGLGGRKAA